MLARLLPAAVLSLAAGAAFADEIALVKPMQAASLHEGGIDMVVYYLESGDAFEVVATYAPQREPYEPARLRMSMADGDAVRFGMPGERQVIYGFARTGVTLRVTAEPTNPVVKEARLD